jgi:RNA polymerase sigma-70 factor, ECF subfamily
MATTVLELNPQTVAAGCCYRQFEELTDVIIRHMPRFHRIAQRHLRDTADAEDAVQDALLSALSHVGQFRGQAQLSTWLTAIVINSARMKLRRRLTLPLVALGETDAEMYPSLEEFVSDSRPDPEEIFRKQEIAEALAYATSRLSPVLQATFQLRDVEGVSIQETARLLGVPTGTVKARTARARRKLKEVIQRRNR